MNESSVEDHVAARAKDLYREFAETEKSLPVFSKPWWLDAAAGEGGWDVALVQKGGQIVAAMPYAVKHRYGMTILGQPALTQKLGPWLRPAPVKPATRLAHEKDLMQHLIDQLPPFDHFTQNWHYDCTNWLPFCWNGFQQTTRYTYLLSDLSSLEKIWAGFQNTTRAECKKAVDRSKLRVRDDLPLDVMLTLNTQTFARQGLQVPYPDMLVRRIDAACMKQGCGKLFVAVDADGRTHAANYIVWDQHSAYGLMSGADPEFRNSGGASLCMWEAIRYAAKVTAQFDFAGSMMEPVERFLRGFGAAQLSYSNISKTPSKLLRLRQHWMTLKTERQHKKAPAQHQHAAY